MMNKINYFRKCVSEGYENLNLTVAAEAGEALLREHWNNQVAYGIPYANDLFNLALVYDEMGEWERALEMYAESARLVHEVEGDSVEFVSRVNNMAALIGRMGRTEHAYRLYAHLAVLLRVTVDPNHLALADSLYNWANAAADMGRHEEAQRLHEEALRIRETAGANDDAVHSLHSLAFLHEETTAKRALEYAQEAMAIAEESLEFPDLEPEILTEREHNYYSACFYLAGLYETQSEFRKAEPLYKNVLRWAEKQGGSNHSVYLNVAARLANTYANRGKHREALHLHQEISETFKSTVGDTHLFYANNLRSMALLHKLLDEEAQAEKLMLESIKIRRSGVDDITEDAMFLIELYLQGNELDKALDMLVLILMAADAESPGYKDLIAALAEVFARGGNEQLNSLPGAMEALCQREKVQETIEKWSEWEKG